MHIDKVWYNRCMNANTANKATKHPVNHSSKPVNIANKVSVSDKDSDEVVSILKKMYGDGYNYREIASSISRTSGWVYNVINDGRYSIRRSDVIAARAAYKISITRKNRTRKHDALAQSIVGHCVSILQNVEELSD